MQLAQLLLAHKAIVVLNHTEQKANKRGNGTSLELLRALDTFKPPLATNLRRDAVGATRCRHV